MKRRRIGVKAHKRYDPRINKKVDVNQYNRNQDIKPYKNLRTNQIATSSKENPLNKKLERSDWDILSTIRQQVNNPTPYFFPLMKYYNKGSLTEEYKIMDIQSNLGYIDTKQVKERIEYYRKIGLIDKNKIEFTLSGSKNFSDWEKKINYP